MAGQRAAGRRLRRPDEVVGRGLVDADDRERAVAADEAGRQGSRRRPAGRHPRGKRAVSVRVNDVIGVAGYVLPGTHVDVLATANPTAAARHRRRRSCYQRPGARRRHEDGTGHRAGQADGGQRRDAARRRPTNPSASRSARTEGKIQLALRNPLDKRRPTRRGIRPAVLLGIASRRAAASARPRSRTPWPRWPSLRRRHRRSR